MIVGKDLVAASATPLVLAILSEGESYGYAIIKRVAELSGGELQWTDGMLYPLLHRLERNGLVKAALGQLGDGAAAQVLPADGQWHGSAREPAPPVAGGGSRAAAALFRSSSGAPGRLNLTQETDHRRTCAHRWKHASASGGPTSAGARRSHRRRRRARRPPAQPGRRARGGGAHGGRSVPGRRQAHRRPRLVSREFAGEHSERLWKQLVVAPDDASGSGGASRREPWWPSPSPWPPPWRSRSRSSSGVSMDQDRSCRRSTSATSASSSCRSWPAFFALKRGLRRPAVAGGSVRGRGPDHQLHAVRAAGTPRCWR